MLDGQWSQDHDTKSIEYCEKIALKSRCNCSKYPPGELGDAIPLGEEIWMKSVMVIV